MMDGCIQCYVDVTLACMQKQIYGNDRLVHFFDSHDNVILDFNQEKCHERQ
eukprot:SAG31_NODE_653_length_13152_cov_4.899487_2_plen_51_part_00